jgi:hypothetical protein
MLKFVLKIGGIMGDIKVGSNSKIYNTTPTPSPPPSLQTSPLNTESSHVSLSPKSSRLGSFCHWISSGIHGVWSWIKKNIFCIKKKEIFPSNFCFHDNQFLENIVEWFFEEPKAFAESVQALPEFPVGSEPAKIAHFIKNQCELWKKNSGKDEMLNVGLVQALYIEFDGEKKKKAAIGRFVKEINQKYNTREIENKMMQFRTDILYKAVQQGNTEQLRQLTAMDDVD